MAESPMVWLYQFKVVLRGVSPMIWRRILLRSDQTIADLHYAIQIAVGWSDSHLHRFQIHGKDYGVTHDGGVCFDDNAEKVRLADFGFRLRQRFLYEYDFGDRWEHDVRLEKVLAWKGQICPVCTGGHRPAPPEDCGGPRIYMQQGDPRMQAWWKAWPREDWALMAETMRRVLEADPNEQYANVIPDRQRLRGALERVKAYQAARPDRLDRRAINERLRQYARGEREELFCETIWL
jgi:hypothetical protein